MTKKKNYICIYIYIYIICLIYILIIIKKIIPIGKKKKKISLNVIIPVRNRIN